MNGFDTIIEGANYILYNDESAKSALEYLDKRIPRSIQRTFKFGFLPLFKDRKTILSLVSQQDLEESKIFVNYNNEWRSIFDTHQLVFPYSNCFGETLGIVGRTLLSQKIQKDRKISKYKNSFNLLKFLHLFGLDKAIPEIIKTNNVFIVEGQFDAMTCIKEGLTNTVALGGSKISIIQFFKLLRYTNNLSFILDNDNAGHEATNKIREKFGSSANIRFINLPAGYKDIDECLRKYNKKDSFIAFLKSLQQGENEKESFRSLSKYV